jgi:hypothetical protein
MKAKKSKKKAVLVKARSVGRPKNDKQSIHRNLFIYQEDSEKLTELRNETGLTYSKLVELLINTYLENR